MSATGIKAFDATLQTTHMWLDELMRDLHWDRGALVDPSPSTPLRMEAAFQKPTVPQKGKRKRKPGAKPGHGGHRRVAPEWIDRREEHRAEVCPDCGGE